MKTIRQPHRQKGLREREDKEHKHLFDRAWSEMGEEGREREREGGRQAGGGKMERRGWN